MQFHEKYAETVTRLEEALNSPKLFVFGRVNAWLEQGATPEEIIDVCTRMAAKGRWNGATLSYFDGPIAQSIADRTKPLPEVQPRAASPYRKPDPTYTPPPEQSGDARDAIDKMRADLVNKGMAPMSVTYQDAKRFWQRGWLTDEAAERFGLSAVTGKSQSPVTAIADKEAFNAG